MYLLQKHGLQFILLILFITGCEKISNECEPISSNEGQVAMRQLALTLEIKHPVYGYVSVYKIDSVKIKIDGALMGTFSSGTIDTNKTPAIGYDDTRFSQSKTSYLVHIPNHIDTSKTHSISDYQDYLENCPLLSAGNHICEISGVYFKDLKNNIIVMKPQQYCSFSVSEGAKSSFIGNFEITYIK